MTTKYRIVLGFALLMAALITVAVIGYRALGTASDGFSVYNRLSRANVLMSDAGTRMQAISLSVERFFADYDPAHIKRAEEDLGWTVDHLQQALKEMRIEQNQKYTRQAIASLESYKSLLAQLRDEILGSRKEYASSFQPALGRLVEEMRKISSNGASRQNVEALANLNRLWDSLAVARQEVAFYMETFAAEKAESASAAIAAIAPALEEMDGIMVSELARRDFETVSRAYAEMRKSFESLARSGQAGMEKLDRARVLDAEVLTVIINVSDGVDKTAAAYAQGAFEANSRAQKTMLAVSLAGILVGGLIAFIIIYSLIRVLGRMSAYAGRVARGDFSDEGRITEKGEIGAMLASLKAIPAILSEVVDRCNEVAVQIGGGGFRTRLEASLGEGRFRDLVNAVNQVAAAYTGVIDNLPVGVMTAGREEKIRYMNKNLQTVFNGSDYTGQPRADSFRAVGSGGNATGLGVDAMNSGKAVAGEIQIRPGGRRMDLTVSASPLHGVGGGIVGYMEVFNDITRIREAEEIMHTVARDAVGIASRVASSTEELAAQVEQITQGAERQRQQVEVTATAMNQMNATVSEVARNSSEASEQSDGAREKAEFGAGLVNRVVESVNKVNVAAVQLQENMQDLGKQADSVGGVLNVIADIADQTNLLALNAAIEAARAGEAGRGFAVVADEVRKLAEKTMEATHEVGTKITSMQRATVSNIEEVKAAVGGVSEAAALANSSGEALKEIVSLAVGTSSLVASIATAAEEQSAASEEITGAIADISLVITETSEGLAQSSRAVHDLARMAQELRTVVQKLE